VPGIRDTLPQTVAVIPHPDIRSMTHRQAYQDVLI
jgi:hypothetical protein